MTAEAIENKIMRSRNQDAQAVPRLLHQNANEMDTTGGPFRWDVSIIDNWKMLSLLCEGGDHY